MGDVIYIGNYLARKPTGFANIQKVFDDEYGDSEFEYYDLLDSQDQLHAQVDYSKARQGDRFHSKYDEIEFSNYLDWNEFFNSHPTCWKIDYNACLQYSTEFNNLNAASGSNFKVCKDKLQITVNKPTGTVNGPAVVTCFERDSCYWSGNYGSTFQADLKYPCKGTNGYSLEFQYDSAAGGKFTLQKFRFVKSVDTIGNFKSDIDFDYVFTQVGDLTVGSTITVNLKSA